MTYNIGNFLRRLALAKSINDWSLRTMGEKLVKIGAKETMLGMCRFRWQMCWRPNPCFMKFLQESTALSWCQTDMTNANYR